MSKAEKAIDRAIKASRVPTNASPEEEWGWESRVLRRAAAEIGGAKVVKDGRRHVLVHGDERWGVSISQAYSPPVRARAVPSPASEAEPTD